MAVEKLETELQQDAGSQVSSLHKERLFENSTVPKIPTHTFLLFPCFPIVWCIYCLERLPRNANNLCYSC
jgi:hypothetical protein